MGIKNLLKLLKLEKTNIKYLKHETVIIDAMYWIHRFKYAYNKDSQQFLNCFQKLFDTLNKKLILVFDGKTKIKINNDIKSFINILKSQNGINFNVNAINQEFFTQILIKYLQEKNIEYIIAENEADTEIIKHLTPESLILTNDTDLIVLNGDNILFNFNWKNGDCEFYNKNTAQINIGKKFFDIKNIKNFTEMCILSGTDYFKFKGINVIKAFNIISNDLNDWIKNQPEEIQDKFNQILNYYKQNG